MTTPMPITDDHLMNAHTSRPIPFRAHERDILNGTIQLIASNDLADTDNLADACRECLTSDTPSRAAIDRVMTHLQLDDFDYMSNDADDAWVTVTNYLIDNPTV